MVKIKYCKNCASKEITHDYQDKVYGKFQRVQNVTEKKTEEVRCTVCSSLNK